MEVVQRTCEDLIVAGRWVHLSDKEDHQSSRGCINHRKVGGRAICNVRSDGISRIFSLRARVLYYFQEEEELSVSGFPLGKGCFVKRTIIT